MAFEDFTKRTDPLSPLRRLKEKTQDHIKRSLSGNRQRSGLLAAYEDSQASSQPATTQLGSTIQRSQGGNAAQVNTGTQDASGVGALSQSPERASQAPGATAPATRTLGELTGAREASPGASTQPVGAFTSEEERLSIPNGGTFNSIGAQQSTTGRDRAFAQLEALQRIRNSGTGGSTPSNLNPDQGTSDFVTERESRNGRVRLNQQLGDIDRAVRRGAMSARAGEAAKNDILKLQYTSEAEKAKLAQQAEQFGVSSGLQSRGLDIKEAGIASDQSIAQNKLAASQAEALRDQAEADRKFSLDVSRYGLDVAKANESARTSEARLGLDTIASQRQLAEAGFEEQRTRTGVVSQANKILSDTQEGKLTRPQAINSLAELGGFSLVNKYFSAEDFPQGSAERIAFENLEEQDILQRLGR